ncbi:MAG TPA: efflux RND transporter periplasmic adaptor subunit [Niastella sp.]
MKKKLIVVLVCSGLVVLIVFKLIANKRKLDEKNRPVAAHMVRIPVTTMKVKEEEQTIELVKTGILAPYKEAKVLAPSSGPLLRLLFKPGDRVVEGQQLAVIDTRLLEIDLARAEYNVDKLQQDLQTYTELLEGKAATGEKVNEVRQLYNDAQKQVRQLRKQIADATIRSPITGTVSSKEVEEGMYVTTGTEIGSIINQSLLKAEINVTETQVYKIGLGQKTRLTTAVDPNKAFWGTVTFISPEANEAYNYKVEISTAANVGGILLRPGTFVYADLSGKAPGKMLLIPREALNESTADVSIYIADNGRARLRSITTGATFGNKVQVTNGLQPGNEVIISGQINLKDGAFIQISKQQ